MENIEIKSRKISELVQAEYNPRRLTEKQFQELKDSMERLGTLEPAVINIHPDRKNIIISGHQRIKVATSLGMKEYPCVEVSFDFEKEKEANIRMNKNTGEWDMEILLKEFDKINLSDWGFELKDFGVALPDVPDYSVLENNDTEEIISDLAGGVRKALLIDFDAGDYSEASEIIRALIKRKFYIGGFLLKKLKEDMVTHGKN